MINVKVKRLSETAILPTYGSDGAGCMDLYADIPEKRYYPPTSSHTYRNDTLIGGVNILSHDTVKIGTGFAFQPPHGYVGLIFARSGTATKQGLRPANCVGVCDCDYTGEYIIPLHNDTEVEQTIYHGDRIAQLMFIPVEQANLILVDDLDSTDRGSGGFGSTGK